MSYGDRQTFGFRDLCFEATPHEINDLMEAVMATPEWQRHYTIEKAIECCRAGEDLSPLGGFVGMCEELPILQRKLYHKAREIARGMGLEEVAA